MLISKNKDGNGGVIRYDQSDWLDGLMLNYSAIGDTSTIGNSGFLDQVAIDPYRKVGVLAPGPSPLNATNNSIVTSMIVNGVADQYSSSTPDSYLAGGALIHQFSIGGTLTNNATYPKTISHSGHSSITASDVLLYRSSNVTYVLISFNDGTDADICQLKLSDNTKVDDWFSNASYINGSVLTAGVPHPIKKGADGNIYVGNGNIIKQIIPSSGSGTAATILTLPAGLIICDIQATQNYLVIFGSFNSTNSGAYRAESRAYFWDYTSATFTFSYPIEGNLVSTGFIYQGSVGCFTSGRSVTNHETRSTKIHIFDGSIFRTILTVKGSAPGLGGVEVIGDVIRWNSAGTIYQLGSPYGGERKLNKIAVSNGSTAGGMLRNLYDSEFYCSAGTSSSGGLERLADTYATNSKFRFPVVDFGFPIDMKIRVTAAKLYWSEVTSGGNPLLLALYLNKGQDVVTFLSDKTAVTKANLVQTIRTDTSSKLLSANSTDSIQLYGQYSSGASQSAIPPCLRAVEIYFEYIKETT